MKQQVQLHFEVRLEDGLHRAKGKEGGKQELSGKKGIGVAMAERCEPVAT